MYTHNKMKTIWLSKIVRIKGDKVQSAENAVVNKTPRDTTGPGTIAGSVVKPPSNTTYQQRKSLQPEYKEFFSALRRIPEAEQQIVLDALNGKLKRSSINASTQTEPLESDEKSSNNGKKGYDQSDKPISPNPEEETLAKDSNDNNIRETAKGNGNMASPKKRRRKRKDCLPKVIKESQAIQAQIQLQPKLKKRKLSQVTTKYHKNSILTESNPVAKRTRIDSLDWIGFVGLDNLSDINVDLELNWLSQHNLEEIKLHTMAKEYVMADHMQNGLLPIHDAVLKNDISSLKRQIYVWQTMKNGDLNELLTDEDEDCLQLALVNNCFPAIVEVLLEKGLNPNCTDAQMNTVIHLAVLNEVDLGSLEHLMKRIELEMLLTLNDDGYTPLHLAVRQECYLLAECLLNELDYRLIGEIQYRRRYNREEKDENLLRKGFLEYYEKACENLECNGESNDNGSRTSQRKKGEDAFVKQHLKQRLLEAGDMRSGNTALFFAIENKSEHLIYLLLAHLTNPCIQNLSGQDSKTFFNEFGKALGLSLNIDKAMEKVISIIG